MARRNPNKHTIAKGVMRKNGVKTHIHTASSRARTYYAKPPAEGWPGGDPERNGWRPGKGK